MWSDEKTQRKSKAQKSASKNLSATLSNEEICSQLNRIQKRDEPFVLTSVQIIEIRLIATSLQRERKI